jgi:putative transposase
MKNKSQLYVNVEKKRRSVRALLSKTMQSQSIDMQVILTQELIPIALIHVQSVLEDEVTQLTGRKYQRNDKRDCCRWGKQGGSVYLADQKVPIDVPRVRTRKEKGEIKLKTYEGLKSPHRLNESSFKKVLYGISCRRYGEASRTIPEAFGLSASTVSRKYIKESERKLKELQERRFDNYDIVAILIDGKVFQDDELIVALGITITGEKVVLGFVQSGGENASVCREFLENLLERGLRIDNGVLCVVDGSKGLIKGVKSAFGNKVLIQRCHWHKRENVISYLPKKKQESIRKELQCAFNMPVYETAVDAINKVREKLVPINESAVRSLDEGIEEVLTLHKLGMFEKVGKSLKTTNCIESLFSCVGQKTDKVDCWRNSNQKQRWLAASLLDIEPRLNKIKGCRYLPELREVIKKELSEKSGAKLLLTNMKPTAVMKEIVTEENLEFCLV